MELPHDPHHQYCRDRLLRAVRRRQLVHLALLRAPKTQVAYAAALLALYATLNVDGREDGKPPSSHSWGGGNL